MSAQRWWTAAGVVLVAALGATGAVGRGAAGVDRRPARGSLPVADTTVVCPDLVSEPGSPTTLTIASAGRLGGVPDSVTITKSELGRNGKPQPVNAGRLDRTTITTQVHAVVIRAQGAGAAGLVAGQERLIPGGARRGLFSTTCTTPTTDVWLAGAEGRIGYIDTLVLANPGSTIANVTVTAWSTTGRFSPPKLQSFTIAAHQAERLAVADYAPDKAAVTLHVHANSGRITGAVQDTRVSGILAAGTDWLPPTLSPRRNVVIPGVPGGAGARQVVITNPTSSDATVAIRLSTATGNFVPAAHPSVVVAAGHSVPVDLAAGLAGLPGAVLLASDQPVVASALAQLGAAGGAASRPDIVWLPATAAMPGPGAVVNNSPPFGNAVRMFLTAPDTAATVRLTTSSGSSKEYDVPAGRTLAVDYHEDLGGSAYPLLVVTPVRGGPVFASRFLYASGAHGPLGTSTPPSVLPAPIQLPAAVDDLRAALLP